MRARKSIAKSIALDIADPTAPIISRTITSNPAFTQISDANILSLKAVNAPQATTGDILTYTITLENTGNIPTTNLLFSDMIPERGSGLPLGKVSIYLSRGLLEPYFVQIIKVVLFS